MITPVEVTPASTPGQIKLVRMTFGARKQLVFRLTDDRGQAVKLDEEITNPPAEAADWSPQAQANGANAKIRMRQARSYWGQLAGSFRLNLEGAILDQSEHRGFVSFQLEAKHIPRVGIYEAFIERYIDDGNDGIRIDTWPVLLAIEPTAMGLLDGSDRGPLLIPEVRLAMLDLGGQDNGAPFSNLLDDTEFTDVDIIFAQRRVVQLWNETPPPVGSYTPQNFPYRYHWLEATVGHLLLMSAQRYSRNRLAYQAGGIAIDDQSKANEYAQMGQEKIDRFLHWMRNEKARINISHTWAVGI